MATILGQDSTIWHSRFYIDTSYLINTGAKPDRFFETITTLFRTTNFPYDITSTMSDGGYYVITVKANKGAIEENSRIEAICQE